MAIESHVAELERRHQALEKEIEDALNRPGIDPAAPCRDEEAKASPQGRDFPPQGRVDPLGILPPTEPPARREAALCAIAAPLCFPRNSPGAATWALRERRRERRRVAAA
jgi:hypothetical protein